MRKFSRDPIPPSELGKDYTSADGKEGRKEEKKKKEFRDRKARGRRIDVTGRWAFVKSSTTAKYSMAHPDMKKKNKK
jgi:hypothetical protein